METAGFIVDRLATINQKMFLVQEQLYVIRKMSFEEFKLTFSTEEGLLKLYEGLKKATDLNCQRQALILEFDKKIAEMIQNVVQGKDLDDGCFIQDQHKTY